MEDHNANRSPLVSLIVPCFNVAPYFTRLKTTLIAQTYDNIELIIVNDGSTDDTASMFKRDEGVFRKKFSRYYYIEQENLGPSAAVNAALKVVSGEYLAWMDSDDIMDPRSIQLKVDYLMANLDCDLVCNWAIAIDDSFGELLYTMELPPEKRVDNIFEMVFFNELHCNPGCFLLKTEKLFARLKNRDIYAHKELGQGWQLLIPVAYKGKCGYIDEYLYCYIVRSCSHSHNINGRQRVERTRLLETMVKESLWFMPEDEYKELIPRIEKHFSLRRLNEAFEENEPKVFISEYRNHCAEGYAIDNRLRFKRLAVSCPLLRKSWDTLRMLKKLIRL